MPILTTSLILRRLRGAYGPRPWTCWGRGVDVLVDTILSQNTSAANSDAGYRQLRRRFRSWNQVADAPVDEVERHIRVSGLSRQKAPRIQAILQQIRADRKKIDLQFLAELDEQAAYDYLMKFTGVGPKTANCVLLFAFGLGVFPVDTHIHRIARRLKLIGPRTTAERAHDVLKPMIAKKDRYEMHVLLIEHGRRTCRAINPALRRSACCWTSARSGGRALKARRLLARDDLHGAGDLPDEVAVGRDAAESVRQRAPGVAVEAGGGQERSIVARNGQVTHWYVDTTGSALGAAGATSRG
jgi:endonuclease-3